MEFRILGPLEVETSGALLVLGPTKQRVLLAFLLLHSNQIVSPSQIIDALWDEHPPETAATALHGYVSGLRKVLGKERIETRSGGYLLRLGAGELDLERFEGLLDEARMLEPPAAAALLRQALALWPGSALGDLGGATFVRTERSRLAELRLGAVEERIEADLVSGRSDEIVAELQSLVREHPLRERLGGQLMLALYRSGRQAEARDVYRQTRHRLSDQLGLEPGEALRQLERRILEQDPALRPPPALLTPPAGAEARPGRSLRRRRLLAWAVVGLLTVGASAGITIGLTTRSGGLEVRANSVAVIDPVTDRLVADIAVDRRPAAIAAGEGGVWVANEDDQTVSRIDPETRKVIDTIGLGSDVHDIAVGLGSVWVAGGTDGTVTRIDPKSNRAATIRVGGEPVFWVAIEAGSVWATSGQHLVRIDPMTSRVTARISITEPTGLASGLNSLWITTADSELWAVSPSGVIRPSPFFFAGDARAPAVGAGSVWVIVYAGRGVIQPVDPVSLKLGPGTQLGAFPLALSIGRKAVWAVDARGAVLRIDPATAAVVARIPTAPTLRSAIAVGADAVWVAIEDPQ